MNNLPLKDYYLENERFEGRSFTTLHNHETCLDSLCSDQFKWICLKKSGGDMTSNPISAENRFSRTQSLWRVGAHSVFPLKEKSEKKIFSIFFKIG